MISIVNYGMGNIASVANMLRKAGAGARVIETPAELDAATAVILPGVGAFDEAVASLQRLGLWDGLGRIVRGQTVPLLGICLGMQLLLDGSEEGRLAGLGAIPGGCRRFRFDETETRLKVPHMGWSPLTVPRPHALLEGLEPDSRFYFVHSYFVECAEPSDVIATARHGSAFAAVIGRGRVLGAQFHPEKSHRYGLRVLGNFARLAA